MSESSDNDDWVHQLDLNKIMKQYMLENEPAVKRQRIHSGSSDDDDIMQVDINAAVQDYLNQRPPPAQHHHMLMKSRPCWMLKEMTKSMNPGMIVVMSNREEAVASTESCKQMRWRMKHLALGGVAIICCSMRSKWKDQTI